MAILDVWKSLSRARAQVNFQYLSQSGAGPTEVDINSPLVSFWRTAREWDGTMRVRNRWILEEASRALVENRSRKQFSDWGVDESRLAEMARCNRIEVVSNPSRQLVIRPKATVTSKSSSEALTWPDFPGGIWDNLLGMALATELNRMPWESLLVMAARKYQNHERLLVYRRIVGLTEPKGGYSIDAAKALFVDTAPGPLWDVYDFNLEEKAVKAYLKNFDVERKENLSIAELKEYVARNDFAVIHVSGLDGAQGLRILQEQKTDQLDLTQSNPPNSDRITASGLEAGKQHAAPAQGIYFRDERGQPELIPPAKVAEALCAGKRKPLLVTFNVYNSAAQLAAQTVKRGAAAAIGFQDYIDDTVAEIFFANLFRAWSDKGGKPLLDAFSVAVRELNPYTERIRGTGVVLWTRIPLLKDPEAICPPSTATGKPDQTREQTNGEPHVELEFDIQPYPSLNYSVLHNGKRKMFETFKIFKFGGSQKNVVRVEVVLNVAGRNFTFCQSYEMEHHILDLTDQIAIGLTSALSRSLRESVRTTIFVRVTAGKSNDERFCKTFDVSLLAVDEWKDDEQSGIFLPSFVLPRDPIVSDVIARAQGYLMAIADDAAQGFDGYQSCDDCEDPAEALEPQARAIWYALQHDYAVKYINPPPTFTEFAQRLRTPSEILKGGRGTCIDLALLLAACFEDIGLHPVVFLLTGHAFTGYWTTEEEQEKLKTTKRDPTADWDDKTFVTNFKDDPLGQSAENVLAPVEWKFERERLPEIRKAIAEGRLVAIEATYLTNSGSFSSACDVGGSNLDNVGEFDSMLDIKLARDKGVTPLPIAMVEGV